MEPFADAVRLRRHRFGLRVVNIIYCQIKLVILLLYFSIVLCASVGQYSQHRQSLRRVERRYTVIQQICRRNRRFGDIQLAVSDLRVRVNERLLIDTSDTFQISHVERVLRAQITRTSGLNFATGLVITGFTFQCGDLAVSQLDTFTGHFFFQCFQTLFEVFKIVAQLDRTNAAS